MLADNRYGAARYVETVPVRDQSNDVGTVLGGAVGGLLGHQVGDGYGSTATTIGGAMVGVMADNTMEDNMVISQTCRVAIRLNNNSHITLTRSNLNGLRVGDHAHIENNTAVPY